MTLPLVALLVAAHAGWPLLSTSRDARALAQNEVAQRASEFICCHGPTWTAQGARVFLRVWNSAAQLVPAPRGRELLWPDAVAELTPYLPRTLLNVLRWTRATARCSVDRWLALWDEETPASFQTYEITWVPPVGAFLLVQVLVLTTMGRYPDSEGDTEGDSDNDAFEEVEMEEEEEHEEVQVEEEAEEVSEAFEEVDLELCQDEDEFEEIEGRAPAWVNNNPRGR